MSAHWKSTPTHWCKFCSTYVRDTPLERKNHDASAKHQNNIQRSLREIHKEKGREERDKQRAKDEVARLNGLVQGGKGSGAQSGGIEGAKHLAAPAAPGPQLSAKSQRRAHAEQLAAMGVPLPEELKKEITGVGGWETVDERVVDDGFGQRERSMADMLKQEEDSKKDVKDADRFSKGVHKRKAEDEEDGRDEEAVPKRQAWGSSFKKYPGTAGRTEEADEDLDALLSGVKRNPEVKKEEPEVVKKEESAEEEKPLAAVPDIDAPAAPVKQEENSAPPVMFKKRKVKR